jgi:hypothetical protein
MSLSSQIEHVFANAARPLAGNLFEGDSEGADELFRAREWHDLRSSELDYHSFALRVFSPAAFAYYLPAFMIAALENESLGLADVLIDCLSPPSNNPSRPSFARRWSCLTQQQQAAVIAFMQHFSHRNPIAIQATVSALEATNAG